MALASTPSAMPNRNSTSRNGSSSSPSAANCRPNTAVASSSMTISPISAGGDAGEHQPAQILGDLQRRGEHVDEVARPDVLEERHGDALHDAREKIPEQHRTQQAGGEIDAAGVDAIEVARNEAPQHDVHRHPGDHRQHAHRAAAHQIDLAQRNGCNRTQLHALRPARQRLACQPDEQLLERGCAVLLGQLPRIALEQDPAMGYEQYAVTGFLHLVHVVRGPEDAATPPCRHRANELADQVGGRWIERGRGLVEQQQARLS